jgi:hypothetical protein
MSGYLWFVFGLFTGVSLLAVFNLFNTKFTKDKQLEEGYNEHNLPEGCKLIRLGDKYMFEINLERGGLVDMEDSGYFIWTSEGSIYKYCLTKDKQFAIKRGIETFEFFKALGKI